MTDRLVRLTPRKAPFRRAGVHFASTASVTMKSADLNSLQVLQLVEEPLVDVDGSDDGGATWQRFSLPPEGYEQKITDPAMSPDRAIDPTAPIFARAPIVTRDGVALPPEAADPAIPVARVTELEALLATSEERGIDLASRLEALTADHDAMATRLASLDLVTSERDAALARVTELEALVAAAQTARTKSKTPTPAK